jgi:hypothetical protein
MSPWADLRITAPGCAPFETEAGTHGRLSETQHGCLSDPPQRISQPDGGRRLPFACRSRCDGAYQDKFAVRLVARNQIPDFLARQFRDIPTVIVEILLADTDGRGDVPNGVKLSRLGDLNIARHTVLYIFLRHKILPSDFIPPPAVSGALTRHECAIGSGSLACYTSQEPND